jgi:hypothetical protein
MFAYIRTLKSYSNLTVSWMMKSYIPTKISTLCLHFFETGNFLTLSRNVCATHLFLGALKILYNNNIIV